MRFKSVKRFSLACGLKNRVALASLLFAAVAGFGAESARATISVSVYGRDNVAADGSYFATKDTASLAPLVTSGEVDTTGGFRVYDVGQTELTDTSLSNANQILLDVYNDAALGLTTGQEAVIVVTAANAAGETVVPVRAPLLQGDAIGRYPQAPVAPQTTTGYFLGVRYFERTHIQIALYPRDICTYFALHHTSGDATAYGCAPKTDVSGSYYAPGPLATSGSRANLQLKVYILNVASTVADAASLPVLTGTGAQSTLNFVAKGPVYNLVCPNLSGLYYPGDRNITVHTDHFAATTYTIGSAPVGALIAVAEKTSTPLATVNNLPDYTGFPNSLAQGIPVDLVQRVPIAGDQTITDLINSTSESATYYQMAFFLKDAAGLVSDYKKECSLINIQTADIQGFLKKGNCFIATAAFRSTDAGPVEMLRQFRSRVLMQFTAGRAFVSWYYAWSPAAAEWLMENPEFRFPVLMALLPLQVFAWLALHPAVWVTLLSLVVIAAVAVTFATAIRRANRGATR
jgi:hypothetical protein